MSELAVGSLKGLAANSFVIDVASGSSLTQPGMILQVVSTTKTDTFQTAATTPTDITGATVSITPTSTSSKVFVTFNFRVSGSTTIAVAAQLLRDSTVIGGGAVVGSRVSAIDVVTVESINRNQNMSGSFLDSPSSTSSVTYSLKIFGTGGTISVNQGNGDIDNTEAVNSRSALTITAMEVAD